MFDRHSLAALLKTPGTTRDRIGEPFPFRNEKRREITTEWVVGPGNTDPDDERFGEYGDIVLTMTSYHYPNAKKYRTTLRVEIVGANMRQTTIAFGLKGETYDVGTDDVLRFSAKSMREHHARCLKLVEYSADHAGMTLEAGVAQYRPKQVPA